METNDPALGRELDPSAIATQSRGLQGNAGARNRVKKPWTKTRASVPNEKAGVAVRVPMNLSDSDSTEKKMKLREKSPRKVSSDSRYDEREMPRSSLSTGRQIQKNYKSEKQQRQERQAEAISNRPERKRNPSAKTKEAVLKAMMNSTPSPNEPDHPKLPKSFLHDLSSKRRLSTMENSEMYEKVLSVTSTSGLAVSDPTAAPEGSLHQSTRKRSSAPLHKKTVWFQKATTKLGKLIGRGAKIHETSNAQQQRWLNAVYESMNEAKVAESLYAERPQAPRHAALKLSRLETEEADETTDGDIPQITASSQSTDDESVGSMVFLFNWLACTPVDGRCQINRRGKLVLVGSFDSSNSLLSGNSVDENQQKRFNFVCSS